MIKNRNLHRRKTDIFTDTDEPTPFSWASFFRAALVLLLIAGGLGLLGYEFYGPPFMSYRDLPARVLKQDLHPGDSIPIESTRCSTKKISSIFTTARELVNVNDNTTTSLPSSTSSIEPGCSVVRSENSTLPTTIKPGRYYIRGTIELEGTFTNKTVVWHTEEFNVTPAPPPPAAKPIVIIKQVKVPTPVPVKAEEKPPTVVEVVKPDTRNWFQRLFNTEQK